MMLLEPEGCPLRALVQVWWCGWYGHHTIEDPVHHDDLAVGSSFIGSASSAAAAWR